MDSEARGGRCSLGQRIVQLKEHKDKRNNHHSASEPAQEIGARAFGTGGRLAVGEDSAQKKTSGETTEMSPIVDSREEKAKRENRDHPGNQA